MSKRLVAYFSASGTTKRAAEMLAEAAGSDLYEIRPEVPYTSVGFPIWWYVAPTIINTFLESYDFSGKTIVLFATSGGSGFGKTVKNLQGSVSPSAVIKEGKILNGRQDAAQLKAWIDSLGV